jgi:hypothetical protein
MATVRKSDEKRLLAHLKARRGKWCGNLYERGRFGVVHSRISGLRSKGHAIEGRRFGTKRNGRVDFRYRLVTQ